MAAPALISTCLTIVQRAALTQGLVSAEAFTGNLIHLYKAERSKFCSIKYKAWTNKAPCGNKTLLYSKY